MDSRHERAPQAGQGAMLTARTYASIMLMFAVLFVMFLFITVSSDELAGAFVNERAEEFAAAHLDEALLAAAFLEGEDGRVDPSMANNPRAAIISADPAGEDAALLMQWCAYNKHRYRILLEPPDAQAAAGFDVLLFGELAPTPDLADSLRQCARTGVPMVFLRLPAYEALAETPALRDVFGIESCVSPAYAIDGVKIFADFFLSGERIYADDDDYGYANDMRLRVPYFRLRAGYDVYATAVLAQQGAIANEALPALLWRTYTEKSDVYVVNSDVFRGVRMLGVITAFLSQSSDVYIYPIVNAQSIAVLGYPNFAQENAQVMRARYTRSMQGFGRDILWPNIVKILRNYGARANFFVASQLDYADGVEPRSEEVATYWKEIRKLSGSIGLSLAQVSQVDVREVLAANAAFFGEAMPDHLFSAAYCPRAQAAQVAAWLAAQPAEALARVTTLLTDFEEGAWLLDQAGEDVLRVMTTLEGYAHEAMDDIQLIALNTALGLCVQRVDIARALFPQEEADDWRELSREWSRANTYLNDFAAFEATTIDELAARARNFLAMNFRQLRDEQALMLVVEDFREEAWFILRVRQAEVASIIGGEAVRLSDSAYLVRAQRARVRIELREAHVLGLPD